MKKGEFDPLNWKLLFRTKKFDEMCGKRRRLGYGMEGARIGISSDKLNLIKWESLRRI